MNAHELARILLAGPDLKVVGHATHCGCDMPSFDRSLRVVVRNNYVWITDGPDDDLPPTTT